MLSKILSVSGRPGLYKLVSTGKNMNVVESLIDGKRIPVYITEKMVALSDISIYTTEEDVPLRIVLQKIKEKEEGKKTSISSKSANKEVFDFIESILPEYDKEKVYASDIKKLITWYNILIENNIDFQEEEKEEEAAVEKTENEETTTDNTQS